MNPDIDLTYHFPPDFLWGTATSAHQVEGENENNDWWAWEQDGRAHDHKNIFENHVSGAACAWWAGKAEEDIALMADLGTNAHRLSLEWSRIEPRPGVWDEAAMARYREILTAMQRAGINPMITLFHFTLPLWLEEQGGWKNPSSLEYFRRFTEKVVSTFGDLCTLWCTVNEPNVYATHTFFKGPCPPQKRNLHDYFDILQSVLKAHAVAYETLHRIQPEAHVGLAKHLILWEPGSWFNPLDRALYAVLRHNFNALTVEVLQTGRWRPSLGKKAFIPQLRGTLDWVGVNYYQRYDARINLRAPNFQNLVFVGRHGLEKGPGWWGEFWPDGLLIHMEALHKRFHLPIYITENGVPDPTDEHRPHYLLDHLHRVWQALRMGIEVRGYFHWSLVDNFEWAEGYNPEFRFGLYAVDFETQVRTPRRSASLYREIATSRTISSAMAQQYAPESLDVLTAVESTHIKQIARHLSPGA